MWTRIVLAAAALACVGLLVVSLCSGIGTESGLTDGSARERSSVINSQAIEALPLEPADEVNMKHEAASSPEFKVLTGPMTEEEWCELFNRNDYQTLWQEAGYIGE